MVCNDGGNFPHLVPEYRVKPVLYIEHMIFNIREHQFGGAMKLIKSLPVFIGF